MTALLRVELTRLRWRRAVLLLLVGAVVVPAVLAAVTAFNTRPVSDGEMATARENGAREIRRCERNPGRLGVESAELCEDTVIGWYTAREPLSLGNEREFGSGMTVVTVLVLLMMLLGTTFVGHDWSSGSMSNQLLFEPRRSRVWAAKALVVTGVAFLVTAVVSTAYWLVLGVVARSRDLPPGPGVLRDSIEYGLRGALVAAAAALAGYALTMLFRSTVATIGVLFAFTIVGGMVIAVVGLEGRWQPGSNLEAVLRNGTTYSVETPEPCWNRRAEDPAEGSECDPDRDLSLGSGATYYGVLLLAAGVASVASFRRRDVP
ncbi:hypothetical protein [Nocardioides dongkuii]|uniref:hypothetical protein n=1 Tax=Nocardioides dongkuii TaxID=2760089 RepID=UPI0015FA6515|nr:hypothetical protein [Nocardioides dongkuii]